MLQKDFEIFKEKYQETSFTKSSNNLVLELYSFILKNENVDSDFWTEGNGFEDIHRILFDFDESDWTDLKNDVKNWTSFQVELFTNGLLCPDYYKADFSENEIYNLENRFAVLPILLEIGETEGEISNNIEDFIKSYFPLMNAKSTKIEYSLKELKKWNDNEKGWRNRETGQIVRSPFTETIENAYKKVCS
ncbi:hypothetical protein [Pedobacter mendelii]|uniref:Uncharacterized protein n=1 Tax=Pedobacter mendelii TaxID=1908240 RepID=A0ABQ2BGX7_9SPHI|nr:hypothetical protein [Pedobacter mendelii]GGI24384.1 hypothetical protein GCM10008119_12390 [Pedobacter mendelii]